jgi:hypothetical protein
MKMDDDTIPHPAIVLVKGEPLELESEDHTHPFVSMVIIVLAVIKMKNRNCKTFFNSFQKLRPLKFIPS